ncbi:hypothetical protein M885DRAFT_445542 [Pelagophyceae sp. CCMP2097]|nr:hypothetical protein M885DRAFT_445542 [Pelagophyceae sp. CCMP2097]
MVTKEEFTEAVDAVDVSESDREILERLFVMLDKTGEDRINHKELVVGITPFISASTAVKLEFAFEMFDADGAGKLKHADFRFVVMTLNAVASYFGDPCMQTERIDAFVDEAARHLDADTTGFLAILGLGAWCAEQPITLDFIEGRGTSKYGNKPN